MNIVELMVVCPRFLRVIDHEDRVRRNTCPSQTLSGKLSDSRLTIVAGQDYGSERSADSSR